MKVVKSGDVSKKPVEVEGANGVSIRWLITKDDGAWNFSMRMFELEPAGHTPLHAHEWEHEVFIVEGKGTFVCEGKEHPFEAEHVIFVDAGKEHCFKNTGEAVLRFLCLVPVSAC